MENKYKVPWHIRQFVKTELMDYEKNVKLAKDKKSNTRKLLIVDKRLTQIENVLNNLNDDDREAAKLIFFKKYSPNKAEIERGISKAAYYHAMNKVIFLVAVEMDLI